MLGVIVCALLCSPEPGVEHAARAEISWRNHHASKLGCNVHHLCRRDFQRHFLQPRVRVRIQRQSMTKRRYLWSAENVHALEGLACRKRVAPASSPATPTSRVQRSHRLRSALAAAPGLLAHALVTKQ